MPHPEDRIVAPCLSGCWEVRVPGATRTGLHAPSRSEALQWAWNITRSTGGQVFVHRSAGSQDRYSTAPEQPRTRTTASWVPSQDLVA